MIRKTLVSIAVLAVVLSTASAHDLPPYTYIDPTCYAKAPPIEGAIVIAAVRTGRKGYNRWLVCYNGIAKATGRTKGEAWDNFVNMDLIPRLEKLENRARESRELVNGGDIWQYGR